jgi:pimeloyl-ACP methyl ester carboxylesterase
VAALGLLAPVGIGRIHWGVLPWIPVGTLATPAWLAPLLPHTVGRWAIALILTLAYGGQNRFDRHDVDEFWAPSQFPGFAYAARHLLHVFDWSVLSDERLRRLPTPTLVAIGTRDRFVDPAGLDRVRRAAPHVETVLVPGAGHIIPEESADVVNPLLVALARRVQIDRATG